MDYIREFFCIGLLVVLIFILLVVFIAFVNYEIGVNFSNINYIDVLKGDVLVYRGKSAYVDVTTGGMTTTVSIYKRLFPFRQLDKYYSDNDIKIIPTEQNKGGE